jgi:tRNA pseudouridine38-40 synthase
MLQVARGLRPIEDFAQLLEGRPRRHAGPTAPAQGLYFAGAGYRGERLLPA